MLFHPVTLPSEAKIATAIIAIVVNIRIATQQPQPFYASPMLFG